MISVKHLKMDCHVHTCYSNDCGLSLAALLRLCPAKGLNAVAITDHNTIRGALALRENAPFKVVIGEEIQTLEGKIIGYFLEREIPPGLTAQNTAEAIKAQGGLVCIPHPFDRLRKSAINFATLSAIITDVDIIEAYNARNLFPRDNNLAIRFARRKQKPVTVGSDCRTVREIGRSYLEIDDFTNASAFLHNLAGATVKFTASSFVVHCYTMLFQIQNAVRRWPHKFPMLQRR